MPPLDDDPCPSQAAGVAGSRERDPQPRRLNSTVANTAASAELAHRHPCGHPVHSRIDRRAPLGPKAALPSRRPEPLPAQRAITVSCLGSPTWISSAQRRLRSRQPRSPLDGVREPHRCDRAARSAEVPSVRGSTSRTGPATRWQARARSPEEVDQVAHRFHHRYGIRSSRSTLDLITTRDQDRRDRTRNGKPLVREGRKATGLSEFAGPPK